MRTLSVLLQQHPWDIFKLTYHVYHVQGRFERGIWTVCCKLLCGLH